MRIGELSRRTGVSHRLLRYYQEQGLLHPTRLPSGYRVYAEPDVRTVGQIRALLAAGLSTGTIAEALPCLGAQLAPACPEVRARLSRERDRISATIDELETSRRLLDDVITPSGSADRGPRNRADFGSPIPRQCGFRAI